MYEKFKFKTTRDIEEKCKELGIYLPLSTDMNYLKQQYQLGGRTLANRIAIQPMEGCDGTRDGSLGELTTRRYHKFAESGAAFIWFEAVAVENAGRANPRQLYLNSNNQDSYKRVIEEIKEISMKENGYEPMIIMQATHSGRYSKPNGKPEPIIAYNNPIFEKENSIPKENIITDEKLQEIEERIGESAKLAEQVGFDGVDVKCCHRYLNSELLSAYTREGLYGGSFENRTRFLINGIKAAKAQTSNKFEVTTRLNIYDGFPYPYGFGVKDGEGLTPDMTEPIKLVKNLHEDLGLDLLDITLGNPYVNPHVNRPFNEGGYMPEEHPLEGVARIYDCTKVIQQAFPELAIISSGPSYMREFAGILAAGAIAEGYSQFVGFGRMAFAYPKFAKDLLNQNLQDGKLDSKKVCLGCGKCTELMRANSYAGCVIRDSEAYFDIYTRDVLKK